MNARFLSSFISVIGLLISTGARGGTTVDAIERFAWGANIGWLDWRADQSNGAIVGEFVCSGNIYGSNIGWINLGDGTPEDGIQYQNNSATDFGVNRDLMGNLRGFAYGANVGWIQFEDRGAPRVDLRTGRLSGSVYGANVGWIRLEGPAFNLKVNSIPLGEDSDQDGIADAWEIMNTGSLKLMDGTTDFDRDGSLDREEYDADTDPFDPADDLRILSFSVAGENSILTWRTKSTRNYMVQSRPEFDANLGWVDSASELQIGTGELLMGTVPNNPSIAHQFFRIEAVHPLAIAPQ